MIFFALSLDCNFGFILNFAYINIKIDRYTIVSIVQDIGDI